MRDFAKEWMWSEAVEMLARAERMHREFFRPTAQPSALPGVPDSTIEAGIDEGHLVISGTRMLPPELRTATIHRLELPQGRFHRHLRLPPGRYSSVKRAVADGCLLVKLEKA
jgi:hypothetical protein